MTIVEAARHPCVPLRNDERSNFVRFIAPISKVLRPKGFVLLVSLLSLFYFFFIFYNVDLYILVYKTPGIHVYSFKASLYE